MGEQWSSLATMAVDLGEAGLAREALALYLHEADDTRQTARRHATVLGYLGDFEGAFAILERIAPMGGDAFDLAHSKGSLALVLGKAQEARRYLEEAVRLRRQSGVVWYRLATLVDFSHEPELADRLASLEGLPQGGPLEDRVLLHYALGKLHSDLGDHPRAFAAFSRGNREMQSIHPYDPASDREIAMEAVRGYDAERIARMASEQSEPTDRTIFVTGLPRSGTSLVEQILTSHDEVADGGEINYLGLLAQDIRGTAWPPLRDHVDRVGPPALARLWNHWLQARYGSSGRIVDKTNQNTRMLGLAASLLPDAPLIWLRREPIDCAWSCYRTCFPHGMGWSNDLEDIAAHFRLEDTLLDRWQEILGERLLVVQFENLVADPVDTIRRLLAHCGLEEQPQAFAPHENRRAMTTSSLVQVRSPINLKGVGRAAPYREFLEPFVAAYRD